MDQTNLVELPSAELADGIGQLHALMTSVLLHLLRWIAAYDEKESWREDGSTSMTSWVQAALCCDYQTASGWVEVARALRDLPHIAAKLEEGALSFDQVRQLVRFATPETDEDLADEAGRYTVPELRRLARRVRAVTREEDEDAHRRRRLRMRWDEERSLLFLSGRLPAPEGAVVHQALHRIADQAPPNPDTGFFEPIHTRCADALVQLASATLDDEQDADRATVSVHVDASILAGGEGMAELEGGPALSLNTAIRMACDARWQLIVDGSDGSPIGIGRTSRKVPRWLRRQLSHRDGGCRFPGCHRKGWVSAHHVNHWARGGHTDLDNLLLVCGVHHRIVHEGGWRIEGDPNGELRFIRPDGLVRTARPPPLRPENRFRIDGEEQAS